MTEERNIAESVGTADELVSRTYRDIAKEHAPEHLDRAVLKEAASEARPRYGRLRSWTRPMAWVATAMLSVAIVLELNRLPEPQPVPYEDSAIRFEEQRAIPKSDMAEDAAATRTLEKTRPAAAGRSADAPSSLMLQADPTEATAKKSVPEAAPELRQRSNNQPASFEAPELAAPEVLVDEFKLQDRDMLRRADDMARLQSGQNREAGLSGNSTADSEAEKPAAAAMTMEAPGCDETATAKPETWLACIAELEAAGLAGEAAQQRERLRQAFPEFDPG